jgi:hypothetical protein
MALRDAIASRWRKSSCLIANAQRYRIDATLQPDNGVPINPACKNGHDNHARTEPATAANSTRTDHTRGRAGPPTALSPHGCRCENGVAHAVEKFFVGRNDRRQRTAQFHLVGFDKIVRAKANTAFHHLQFARF